MGKDVVRKSTGVGLPCWSSAYESPANAGGHGFEDPACHGGTKPMSYNYRAHALEPSSQTTEARVPRACAPQQEKPLQ